MNHNIFAIQMHHLGLTFPESRSPLSLSQRGFPNSIPQNVLPEFITPNYEMLHVGVTCVTVTEPSPSECKFRYQKLNTYMRSLSCCWLSMTVVLGIFCHFQHSQNVTN